MRYQSLHNFLDTELINSCYLFFSSVIFVRSVSASEHRVYDKRQCCYICSKMVLKLARHLESHANVSEVAKVLALPKASKSRKKELERLRLKGNYYHNIKVLETKRGQILKYIYYYYSR